MSQHLFRTVCHGHPAIVMMGWDRPLSCYFMVVERDTDTGITESEEEESAILYASINECDAFGMSLDDFRVKLADLGISVPESMFREAQTDCRLGLQRRCWHDANGKNMGVSR